MAAGGLLGWCAEVRTGSDVCLHGDIAFSSAHTPGPDPDGSIQPASGTTSGHGDRDSRAPRSDRVADPVGEDCGGLLSGRAAHCTVPRQRPCCSGWTARCWPTGRFPHMASAVATVLGGMSVMGCVKRTYSEGDAPYPLRSSRQSQHGPCSDRARRRNAPPDHSR